MHQQPNLILYEADAADKEKIKMPTGCVSQCTSRRGWFVVTRGFICYRTPLTLMIRHKTSLLAAVQMKMILL